MQYDQKWKVNGIKLTGHVHHIGIEHLGTLNSE